MNLYFDNKKQTFDKSQQLLCVNSAVFFPMHRMGWDGTPPTLLVAGLRGLFLVVTVVAASILERKPPFNHQRPVIRGRG